MCIFREIFAYRTCVSNSEINYEIFLIQKIIFPHNCGRNSFQSRNELNFYLRMTCKIFHTDNRNIQSCFNVFFMCFPIFQWNTCRWKNIHLCPFIILIFFQNWNFSNSIFQSNFLQFSSDQNIVMWCSQNFNNQKKKE